MCALRRWCHFVRLCALCAGYVALQGYVRFAQVVRLWRVVCPSSRLLLRSSHHPRAACFISPQATKPRALRDTTSRRDITRDSDTYSQCLLASPRMSVSRQMLSIASGGSLPLAGIQTPPLSLRIRRCTMMLQESVVSVS